MKEIKGIIGIESITSIQKTQLIEGVTTLLRKVLGKNPETTFVNINEVETDNRGVVEEQATERKNGKSN